MVRVVTATLKRILGVLPLALLFLLLLVSLYLMTAATQNTEQFGRLYSILFVVNVIEILVLGGLIGTNLGRLLRQYRNRATGSRLTARLVAMFVIIAVVPVSVVYYFSLDFIRRGVDSWFDVRVEQALQGALDLSRAALDWRTRDMLRQVEDMSRTIADTPEVRWPRVIHEMRYRTGAEEVTLFSSAGTVVVFSGEDAEQFTPSLPDRVIVAQVRGGTPYVGLDPPVTEGGSFHARIVLAVPALGASAQPLLVQALFPVPRNLNALAQEVQDAYAQYQKLAYLRKPLKSSFTLTLSLALLLSLFAAVWAAFYLARRLVAPIRLLAIGTRAVAAGDYARQLPEGATAADELGFLVRSFNTMTTKIASARDEARRSQRNVENQKAYLETVLGHLSSGVLTFGHDGVLRTANAAAERILGADLQAAVGDPLASLGEAHPHLQPLVDMLLRHAGDTTQWQEQIVQFGIEGRQVLMCRGAVLPISEDVAAGHVVVFDDITTLIQAQRDAAWGEVARRLAHEIKNPLTPIQLSAERLRHKYLPMMNPDDADLLLRATHTIVQQVETMKEMVKAFSDYARTPKLDLRPLELNALIGEVLELYRSNTNEPMIETDFDTAVTLVDIDGGRLRQLLHNLIKNAIEAVDPVAGRIRISTRLVPSPELHAVEVCVEDNGPGIPAEMMDKLFEPYVSSKPKGTGLGLAIVKKIVEEHNGVIRVENGESGGARFVIRLPLRAASPPVAESRPDSEGVCS